jgi:hypothetical protein
MGFDFFNIKIAGSSKRTFESENLKFMELHGFENVKLVDE